MTKMYKTVRGKSIDIDKLKLANESTVAVGNMRVNARGDAIGAGGKVVAGRNQIMDKVYAVEEAPYSPNDPSVFKARQAHIEAENARKLAEEAAKKEKQELEPEVEQTPAEPVARGNLASSFAKSTAKSSNDNNNDE